MELKITIDGLEKERDFYFGKLRDIEVLCQEADKNPIIQKILEILYATEVRFWCIGFYFRDIMALIPKNVVKFRFSIFSFSVGRISKILNIFFFFEDSIFVSR